MAEKQEVVPVEVRMMTVRKNIEVAMQQIYDCSINIEAEKLGETEGKDTPEVTRLKKLAEYWMKKRDFFRDVKMKELEAEKAKLDSGDAATAESK